MAQHSPIQRWWFSIASRNKLSERKPQNQKPTAPDAKFSPLHRAPRKRRRSQCSRGWIYREVAGPLWPRQGVMQHEASHVLILACNLQCGSSIECWTSFLETCDLPFSATWWFLSTFGSLQAGEEFNLLDYVFCLPEKNLSYSQVLDIWGIA